jgi:hypothetical protein
MSAETGAALTEANVVVSVIEFAVEAAPGVGAAVEVVV